MTDVNKLKLLAGKKITESNDKSASARKHMLRYIKEADEHEVKAFLLDGYIGTIQEDEKEIIDKRIQKSSVLVEMEQLNEVSPKELFMGQVEKLQDIAKNISNPVKDFFADKGANFVHDKSSYAIGPLKKAAEKAATSPASQIKNKGGGFVQSLSDKLNAGNVTNQFNQSIDQLQSVVGNNPAAMATGIVLAIIAAIGFGLKSKKSDEKKASSEVYASLKKNNKLDKDSQKAADAVAKAYKK